MFFSRFNYFFNFNDDLWQSFLDVVCIDATFLSIKTCLFQGHLIGSQGLKFSIQINLVICINFMLTIYRYMY